MKTFINNNETISSLTINAAVTNLSILGKMVSFIPEGKTKAITTKPGKAFRKAYPSLTPVQIEALVDSFKAYTEDYTFELWNATKAYKEVQSSGSCMTNRVDLVAIYDKLNIPALVLVKNGIACGRALVWNNLINREDDEEMPSLMDVVYVTDSADREKFKNYAREMGWMLALNNHRNGEFEFEGEILDLEFYFHLTTYNFLSQPCPYYDTMTYYDADENILTSYEPEGEGYDLQTLSGEPEGLTPEIPEYIYEQLDDVAVAIRNLQIAIRRVDDDAMMISGVEEELGDLYETLPSLAWRLENARADNER